MNDRNDFPTQDDVLRDAGINPGPEANTQPRTAQQKEPAAPPLDYLTQTQILMEVFQGGNS